MANGFITGVSGFVGGELARELVRLGWGVSGLDLHTAPAISNFYHADINDHAMLLQALRETRPDVIFHLAGVIKSKIPEKFYQANVLGTLALLDSVVESGLRPVVLIASSSAVYGYGYGRRPITEKFKPRPVTHYAASKLAQEMVSLRYFNAFNLPVICVRTFNLLGPGLSPELACSAFAKQIARAELYGQPATIQTGDLSTQRDFVDVRDAVQAYVLLTENGQAGQTYNVASGQAVAIRECLDFLLAHARVPIDVVVDPARVQKNDILVQIGSTKFIFEQIDWKPKIPTKRSLLDMLEDWRLKVKKG